MHGYTLIFQNLVIAIAIAIHVQQNTILYGLLQNKNYL